MLQKFLWLKIIAIFLLYGSSKTFVKLGSVIIFKNVIFLPDFRHGFGSSCSIAELSRKF